MTAADIKQAGLEYARQFDNLDEVGHMSILYDPQFGALMKTAIDRGSPLTQEEVEAVFGELSWEW